MFTPQAAIPPGQQAPPHSTRMRGVQPTGSGPPGPAAAPKPKAGQKKRGHGGAKQKVQRCLHTEVLPHAHTEEFQRHMYRQEKADEPCGNKARHMLLGARLATLAYTDDKPGTVLKYKDD